MGKVDKRIDFLQCKIKVSLFQPQFITGHSAISTSWYSLASIETQYVQSRGERVDSAMLGQMKGVGGIANRSAGRW
jgi:hypothetical protein